MLRILAWAQGVILALDGLVQLFASRWWFGIVPGGTATGPFNAHFVRDVGAAYLVAGASHIAFALRPAAAYAALCAAAAFLVLHAAIHIFDATCGATPAHDFLRNSWDIYLPALAALGLAMSGARGFAHPAPQGVA